MEGFGGSKGVNPKSSELRHIFCMILVVHLGHGDFCYPVARSYFYLRIRFFLGGGES